MKIEIRKTDELYEEFLAFVTFAEKYPNGYRATVQLPYANGIRAQAQASRPVDQFLCA